MKYRKLPRGTEQEAFSVLGLGMGGVHESAEAEIEQVVRTAMEHGINYFDLRASNKKVYAPFGRAIAIERDKVFFQLHLGAVYKQKGDYAWSRDLAQIRSTFEWELDTLGTDYVDMGFLHCVDEEDDYRALVSSGVLDFAQGLKKQGVLRHIGFSSHTPSVANLILDTGIADMMMFSINPAYDFELGDEYGIGSVSERSLLFRRCQAEGVGISVMKPFHGGQLLAKETSPFHCALTRYQCLQYALDRPGVLTALPGVRGLADLEALVGFSSAAAEDTDYSIIGGFTTENVSGNCVYCNHCQPCPAGIDVGLVNKYYDLSKAGDRMAAGHYDKLTVQADACLQCGHCTDRCPFRVQQGERMREIAKYFQALSR